MPHVEDRWFTATGGHKAKTTRHPDEGGNPDARRWRVRYAGPDGRERSKSFTRKTDAEKWMAVNAADLLKGSWIDPSVARITLREYATGWLATRSVEENTRSRLAMQLRVHVYPVLGDVPLGVLAQRPSVIQEWLAGLRVARWEAGERPVAPSHARSLLSTLSSILAAAVDDELISRNPCKKRSVKAPPEQDRKVIPWTAAQVAAVREGLEPRYRAMTDAGSGLGMRIGEVFALSPADIDWLRGTVHIRRQVKLVGNRRCFALPKGGKERDVPLAESVKLRLAEHLREHPAAPVTLPWRTPSGRPEAAALMFTTLGGEAIFQYDFSRRPFAAARRKAGIPVDRDHGFHCLRHFFASALLADGVDIRALAEYLGHRDPGFTLRVYTHLMPSATDRMRHAIDRVFSPDVPQLDPSKENGR